MKRIIMLSIILALSPVLYAQFGWQSVGGIEILTPLSPPPNPPGAYQWPTGWGQDPGISGYWSYGADNKYVFPLDNGQRYAELRVDNSINSDTAYITQTWVSPSPIPSGFHAQQFVAHALPTNGATGVWVEIRYLTGEVDRANFTTSSIWQTSYMQVNCENPGLHYEYEVRIGVLKDPGANTGVRSVLIDRCFIWNWEITAMEWINWDFETPNNPMENRCLITTPLPLPMLTEQTPAPTTYEVYLNDTEDAYPPVANVLVTVDPDDQLSVNSQAAGDPVVLTFTTAEPNLPQTVTVVAYDDVLEEGPHSGSIAHSSTSADPNYNGLIIRSLNYEIEDDDLHAVSIIETGNGTAVVEGKYSDTYSIVLQGALQGGSAVITIVPDSQLELNSAVAGSPIDLTFTDANWSTPQVVTVTAIYNPDLRGNRTVTISHSITGGGYDGVQIPDLMVQITEGGPYCGEPEQQYNAMDYNRDCDVDLKDFAELIIQSPQYMDMNELAALTMQWLQCTDRSDPRCFFWSRLNYINPDAPSIDIPSYPGTYYDVNVPDTLDLAERARLAVHGMTETTDPDFDYEQYWIADLLAQTPAMYHTLDDHVQSKTLQGMPLCRTACGSDENLDVERAIFQVHLKMQGPDGLIYYPIPGRAWALPPGPVPWAGLDYIPTGDHWASLVMNGRMLGGFCIYALKDPDGPWIEAANNLVAGFDHVIIEHADTAYMFLNCTEPNKPVVDYGPPSEFPAAINAWVAEGLAQAYLTLGNTRARDLALKLMNHIFNVYIGPNGEFLTNTHFHAHSVVLLAGLNVVQATGDTNLLNRCVQLYNQAVSHSQPLLGYCPEYIGSSVAEMCGTADMVGSAVKLCQLGYDKWDDVDRWVRNQFAEGQVTDTTWRYNPGFVPVNRDVTPLPGAGAGGTMVDYGTTDHVLERTVGCFGFGAANDKFHTTGWALMHCCLGNMPRAIYYAWKNILTYDGGTLKVNLLLNRASQWADVDSHIPYQGRVDLHIKQNLNLEIRLPEYVNTQDAVCTVNSAPRALTFNSRYAQVGSVSIGDEVSLEFPISERTENITIAGVNYTVIFRGNVAVSIDPPGTNCPTYQRDHYRTGVTQWVSRQRFIPDEEIDW